MVKSILFYFYLLFTVSCVRPDIHVNISESDTINISADTKPIQESVETENIEEVVVITQRECLITKSEQFVGVREQGGNNHDFNNQELKGLLLFAGWKRGQAWCSYMVKGLLDDCLIPNTITGWSPTSYNKKDVIYTDGKFKKDHNDDDILVMSLSYNKFKKDKARYKGIGHTGIVGEIRKTNVLTYEGNTSDDGGRDGDGFYKKIRPLTTNIHITRWNSN